MGAEAIILGVLASYFHERYSIANAIAQVGVSAGIMTIKLLTQLFIDIYGWRGCMLLLGGINLHLVVSGAFLRPIIKYNKESSSERRYLTSDATNPMPKRQEYNEDEKRSSIFTNIVYYLDLGLFQDAVFLPILMYGFGNGYCLSGWLIYLVPFAKDIGFPSYKAVSLASYGGVGNLLGNILYPLLTRRFSANQILFSSTFINVLAVLAHPLCSKFASYIGLVLASIVLGCARAVGTLCLYQLIKEGIEEDQRINAIMWTYVAHSIGSIISGFLSGLYNEAVYRYTLSYSRHDIPGTF